jgi:hypothetical protein
MLSDKVKKIRILNWVRTIVAVYQLLVRAGILPPVRNALRRSIKAHPDMAGARIVALVKEPRTPSADNTVRYSLEVKNSKGVYYSLTGLDPDDRATLIALGVPELTFLQSDDDELDHAAS